MHQACSSMTLEEAAAFQEGLRELEQYFRDPLTAPQRQAYWALLCVRCTLEEWEYAVQEAMARETFYRTPLVAHLLDYVREYRQHAEVV